MSGRNYQHRIDETRNKFSMGETGYQMEIPDIDHSNWHHHLRYFMNVLEQADYGLNKFADGSGSKVPIKVKFDSGDSPVRDPREVELLVNEVIRQYAPEEEWEMRDSEYAGLLAEVGTDSSAALGEATYEFCSRLLPDDSV